MKTAVEWLFEQLPDHFRLTENGFDMLQQAKEMEQKQLIDKYQNGYLDAELDKLMKYKSEE